MLIVFTFIFTPTMEYRGGLKCVCSKSGSTCVFVWLYLQHHTVVSGSLVFALVVLTKVNIHMVQLEKTHQISGRL